VSIVIAAGTSSVDLEQIGHLV